MKKHSVSPLLALLFAFVFITPVLASATTAAVPADIAQKLLIEGNQRFVTDKYTMPQIGQERRSKLTEVQHPFAVIVSCSDSRVPPEIIFNQGLGDLFVVRVAGNVLDSLELGSVEYAVEHLGTKLIVVLGHEKCGAVKATVDGGDIPPNIAAIAAKIQPAVDTARAANSSNIYEASADANISNMVAHLHADPLLAHIDGVIIVGAKYHLESGQVELIK
ncbi:MAG: carbonic anhydrase [Firmicutes bacterium]|nr:carbonic anhydrase [Bacillota bacterium]